MNPLDAHGVKAWLVAATISATLSCVLPTKGHAASGNDWVVWAPSQADYRVGPLRFKATPYTHANQDSLRVAIRKLGRPDSCVISDHQIYAVATWKSLGLVGHFTTLGGFPQHNGKPHNGCAQPRYVQPDYYTLDWHWHTALGLRIGSSIEDLKRLYPKASLHWSNTFYLTTRPVPWMGKHARTGLLTATVDHGYVTGFVLDLQAQGE